MNIVVTSKDPKEFLTRNKILWQSTMKKSYFASVILLLLGICLLIIGQLQPYSFSSDLGTGKTYYNFHFSIGIGTSLILLALVYFRIISKNKKYFNEATRLYVQRAETIQNYEAIITITPSSIKLVNFEESIQTNWSAFIFYKLIKNYVALYKQQNVPSYLIDLSKMSQEDQIKFKSFLSGKFTQKT